MKKFVIFSIFFTTSICIAFNGVPNTYFYYFFYIEMNIKIIKWNSVYLHMLFAAKLFCFMWYFFFQFFLRNYIILTSKMYSIVLKYLQLICAAVIFEKINCDQLQLNVGSDGKLLHGIISCTALCINKVSNLVGLRSKRI